MNSIGTHPLFEPQLVLKIIAYADEEGAHADRPILIEEPEPILILNFISFTEQRNQQEQFFCRLQNHSYGTRSWRYMTRNFPLLVYLYFTENVPLPSFAIMDVVNWQWDDFRVIERISWIMNENDIHPTLRRPEYPGRIEFYMIENPFGVRHWVSRFFMFTHFPLFFLSNVSTQIRGI